MRSIKKMYVFLSLVLGFSSFSGYSQTNESVFSGKVVDAVSGEALGGVAVKIPELGLTVYTDFDGKFNLKNVKAGEYTIVFNFISYKKQKVNGVKVNESNNGELLLKLVPSDFESRLIEKRNSPNTVYLLG